MSELQRKLEAYDKEIKTGYPDVDEKVLTFITQLMCVYASNEDEYEIIRGTFRAGYCWHFAHLLKTTFGRGEVCWAAPFGHIVWVDDNGVPYDAEGANFGEQIYHIPEKYLGECLNDFKHIPGGDHKSTKKELTAIIRQYEDDNKLPHTNLKEAFKP